MGYDSTINLYGHNGKFLGELIDDISFRAIINLIKFAHQNKASDVPMYAFDDVVCEKEVLESFKGSDFENQLADIIKNDDEIAYFGITSV